MIRQLVILLFAATVLRAQEKPDAVVNPETVATSMRRGVDFLVSHQNPDGSFGSARKTKDLNIYAPLPGAHQAYLAGSSGLALSGLLDSGDQRPEVLEAIRKGAAWAEENLPKLRRADQTTTYNVWGHAYGLRAITRLYRIAKTDEEKAKWKNLGQGQIELLNRYEDVNGGWGYLDLYDGLTTQKPSGITTSFMTATALLAMHEAKEVMGVKLDEHVVTSSLDSIERQRTPDFSYVYSQDHVMRPRLPINRPAGSLARSQACNAALRAFGKDIVTDEVITTWTDRFVAREGFLSIGRKRPVPHESFFQISGYFYYYGVYYFTESAKFLPAEKQPEHAEKLAQIILFRQEKDGSWWDYPLYDYHQAYGTGYCLMALAWCRDHLKS
ncbi:hypothetical protein JIN85_19245 [Luteolibacter pohnpeiensis]|uniref:Squalene cyclase C-terminal domain-containing protein n=1 Tax=Luteolibacter pohnpeiensis TaxID=454153 RepID=A0A934S7L3_9BACT|nr:prenyltransferase/squalene oxidase repeat-containing protein [Luteolibacter pohnpeiensis]MBK1884560.1 hypothetical protein [Luteolibacter pohnpeiensis]